MLKHSKISEYKIKKILKCFACDYSAAESQKIVKLGIRTIERYYNIFRNITKTIAAELVLEYGSDVTYIGCVQGFYCEQNWLGVFRYGRNFYLANVLSDDYSHSKLALTDKAFSEFSEFFYKSVKKFYGFSKINYYNQIIERPVRWYFRDNEKFYKAIYKKLKDL